MKAILIIVALALLPLASALDASEYVPLIENLASHPDAQKFIGDDTIGVRLLVDDRAAYYHISAGSIEASDSPLSYSYTLTTDGEGAYRVLHAKNTIDTVKWLVKEDELNISATNPLKQAAIEIVLNGGLVDPEYEKEKISYTAKVVVNAPAPEPRKGFFGFLKNLFG